LKKDKRPKTCGRLGVSRHRTGACLPVRRPMVCRRPRHRAAVSCGGTPVWGNTRDVLRDHAYSHGYSWNVRDSQLVAQPLGGFQPGEAVVVNSFTGMIGIPEQTEQGICVTTLMNPSLRWGTRVKINNDEVMQFTQNEPGVGIATPSGPQFNQGKNPFVPILKPMGITSFSRWSTSAIAASLMPFHRISCAISCATVSSGILIGIISPLCKPPRIANCRLCRCSARPGSGHERDSRTVPTVHRRCGMVSVASAS
jgi:hypothetical protein